MSREPKTPQDLQTQHDVTETSSTPSGAAGGHGRREYKAPRLKRLGSVRDLTLGSPRLPFGDGRGGFRAM
jgi:hypothetical protein